MAAARLRRPRVARSPWPVVAALLVALVAVTEQVLVRGPLTWLDGPVHVWVAAHRPPHGVELLLTGIAMAGQRWLITPLVATAAVVVAARARRVQPLVVAAGTLGLLWATAGVLKSWTGRIAPASGADAVHAGGSSFPSGHAAGAIVGSGLLVLLLHARPGPPPARCWATVPALGGTVVGVDVIVLDYHWVSDTLGAWLLAALVLRLAAHALTRRTGDPPQGACCPPLQREVVGDVHHANGVEGGAARHDRARPAARHAARSGSLRP